MQLLFAHLFLLLFSSVLLLLNAECNCMTHDIERFNSMCRTILWSFNQIEHSIASWTLNIKFPSKQWIFLCKQTHSNLYIIWINIEFKQVQRRVYIHCIIFGKISALFATPQFSHRRIMYRFFSLNKYFSSKSDQKLWLFFYSLLFCFQPMKFSSWFEI